MMRKGIFMCSSLSQDFATRIEQTISLDSELLKNHNFFELYPYDGGSGHIHHEIVGTLNDAEIADKVLNQNILAEWGNLTDLDFTKFARWRYIERYEWLTRFYFSVSLSRYCWKFNDAKTAKLVKNIILHFIAKYPPPKGDEQIEKHLNHISNLRKKYNQRTFEENARDDTEVSYMWYDFSPASRFLHILHSLFFLKDFNVFTELQLSVVRQSLYEHAELILVEENNFLQLKKSDNHQSLRGLVLLYAAFLFKDNGLWRDFFNAGCRICEFHADQDFGDDGTLTENSPTYHCFQTWHLRDAFVLLQKLKSELAGKLLKKLAKAVNFIDTFRQPDGFTPVINDGCGLYLNPFLKSLNDYKPDIKSEKGILFKDAKMAFYKDDKHYLVFDASVFTGKCSHYHAGKNALSYWFAGKPFLIDSGCCSYDDNLFFEWYKLPNSHSTLLIDDYGDGEILGVYNWGRHNNTNCTEWQKNDGYYSISSRLVSDVPSWNDVVWNRQLNICDDNLIVEDVVTGATGKKLSFIFNLHPDVKIKKYENGFLLENSGITLNLDFYVDDSMKIDLNNAKCFVDFTHIENTQILVNVTAKKLFMMKTIFRTVK
jgi:hypothetical protein